MMIFLLIKVFPFHTYYMRTALLEDCHLSFENRQEVQGRKPQAPNLPGGPIGSHTTGQNDTINDHEAEQDS